MNSPERRPRVPIRRRWVRFARQRSDGMVKVFRAHHVHIESKGNAPVRLSRTRYNVFIEDPNGVNLELSQIVPGHP